MKNFNFQTVEVLSNEELAAVKGGYGIPTPIVIPDNPAAVDASSNFGLSLISGNAIEAFRSKK